MHAHDEVCRPKPGPKWVGPRGPEWVGPRGAQVGGPTWGPKWVGPRGAQSGWAHVGPTWAQARNLGPQKNPKNKDFKNQNVFCPKCRRSFSMPEKGVPAPFGALPANFLRGPEKSKKCPNFAYFPWWANGVYSYLTLLAGPANAYEVKVWHKATL